MMLTSHISRNYSQITLRQLYSLAGIYTPEDDSSLHKNQIRLLRVSYQVCFFHLGTKCADA